MTIKVDIPSIIGFSVFYVFSSRYWLFFGKKRIVDKVIALSYRDQSEKSNDTWIAILSLIKRNL